MYTGTKTSLSNSSHARHLIKISSRGWLFLCISPRPFVQTHHTMDSACTMVAVRCNAESAALPHNSLGKGLHCRTQPDTDQSKARMASSTIRCILCRTPCLQNLNLMRSLVSGDLSGGANNLSGSGAKCEDRIAFHSSLGLTFVQTALQ